MIASPIPQSSLIFLSPSSEMTLKDERLFYRGHGRKPLCLDLVFVEGKVNEVVEFALALQEAGCFSIVLECVLASVAAAATSALRIPTIGIGTRPFCIGQVN
ncbi:hypothetical protein HYC85_015374 [Camellia sinensis]|uniref:3-methyl-2-oxobutanoate hydroxymethyltransferase n=1 Tax=Camellia sinensis TaxID=4442 RepID=A0A7J7H0A9_CAMSI|nr:hypothetical protein HYC85_015374 [Camellia sinensis]